ncbi:MAG: hypothetical protein ACKO14_01090 [Armatimonadota bacterium]
MSGSIRSAVVMLGFVGAVVTAATATYVLKNSKKTMVTGADSVDALVKRCHEQMETLTNRLSPEQG